MLASRTVSLKIWKETAISNENLFSRMLTNSQMACLVNECQFFLLWKLLTFIDQAGFWLTSSITIANKYVLFNKKNILSETFRIYHIPSYNATYVFISRQKSYLTIKILISWWINIRASKPSKYEQPGAISWGLLYLLLNWFIFLITVFCQVI